MDKAERERHVAELTAHYAAKLPHGQALALAEQNADKPLARLQGNAAPILARLAAGERTREIAQSLGISREALNTWLLVHASEEYRQISAGQHATRLEDATERIDQAADQLEATKGRELAKIASWQLERMLPKLYGSPSKEAQNGINISIHVDRSCSGQITINQEPNEAQ